MNQLAVRRCRLWFVCLALGVAASIFLGANANAQTCQSFSSVTYGTYMDSGGVVRELKLDLRIPTGAAAPTPVVVWVHGGGWSGGTRAMPSRVTELCSRGYAVASIDYRLSGTAKWPAQIQDCKGALRFLRSVAATYNLDPDRFGVWGSSAGGHLVAFLGTSGGQGTVRFGNASVDLEGTTGGNLDRSSRVQAVVDWYGPTDLLQMRFYPSGIAHEDPTSPESKLLATGVALPDMPELAATANPISFLSPEDPPFLLMHGTVDDSVPFHQSELLHRALVTRGLRSSFVPILGAGHGGGDFDAPATLQTVNDFLDANLLNLSGPTLSLAALDASVSESGGPAARFTITRAGSLKGALPVGWTSVGSAALTADFTATGTSVTIPDGLASATFSVTPVDDPLIEGDETIAVALVQSAAYRLNAAQSAATTQLLDSDSAAGRPVISVVALDAAASEAGPNGGSFRISRTGGTAQAQPVNLRWSGTAIPGADYAVPANPVVIPAGQASLDLSIAPNVDALFEPTETVIVSINPTGAYALGAAATSTASTRINELNQGSALPVIAAVTIDASAAEAGAEAGAFLLSRTGSTAAAITVGVAPGPGTTTTDGTDHLLLGGTITFPIGINRVTVPLTPFDDVADEPAESVTLVATPAANRLVGPASAPVTLIDND